MQAHLGLAAPLVTGQAPVSSGAFTRKRDSLRFYAISDVTFHLKRHNKVIKMHRAFTARSECVKVFRLGHMSSA